MKRFLTLPLLLAGAVPLAAQTQAPPAARSAPSAPAAADTTDDGETIVVTGRRLSDTERALADCIKRGCPPDEDINATLAHAENLFVAGDYAKARTTTKASLGRNRKHAARYPGPVSDLERSNGRVSAHLGEKYDYQYSTWGIRRALKAGLPDNDPRLVGANIEIAQMLAATGRDVLARQKFNEAARDAEKINRPDLAAAARLRLAYFDFISIDEVGGRRALEKIAAANDPATRGSRLAAMLILAQDARKRGKPDATEALLAELKTAGLKQPVLIFAPEIKLVAQGPGGEGEARSALRSMATDNFEKKWIDLGFWVRPDGRVEDVEVLRASGNQVWAEPLLKSVKGRIYSPVAENDAEGAYRVERYSYTSFFESKTGSRVRQRGPNARVEFLDLTPAPTPAATGATGTR